MSDNENEGRGGAAYPVAKQAKKLKVKSVEDWCDVVLMICFVFISKLYSLCFISKVKLKENRRQGEHNYD